MEDNPPIIPNRNNQNTVLRVYQQDITPGAVTQGSLVSGGNQKGDIYYGMDGVRFLRLPVGSKGQILTISNGVPVWSSSIPIYANNAAAIAGGLGVGAIYRTGADPDPICTVH